MAVGEEEEYRIHNQAADEVHHDIAHCIHKSEAGEENVVIFEREHQEDVLPVAARLLESVGEVPVLSVAADELVIDELEKLPGARENEAETETAESRYLRRAGLFVFELQGAGVFVADINALGGACRVQDFVIHRN